MTALIGPVKSVEQTVPQTAAGTPQLEVTFRMCLQEGRMKMMRMMQSSKSLAKLSMSVSGAAITTLAVSALLSEQGLLSAVLGLSLHRSSVPLMHRWSAAAFLVYVT
jgi:hypothetical protein